jgi:hypothetical protein
MCRFFARKGEQLRMIERRCTVPMMQGKNCTGNEEMEAALPLLAVEHRSLRI